jgi:uncharacterized protein YPO0396
MNSKKLIKLQEEIAESKQDLSELKGQRTALLETLKTNFNCKDIESASSLLKSLEESLEEVTVARDKIMAIIEEEYDLED